MSVKESFVLPPSEASRRSFLGVLVIAPSQYDITSRLQLSPKLTVSLSNTVRTEGLCIVATAHLAPAFGISMSSCDGTVRRF